MLPVKTPSTSMFVQVKSLAETLWKARAVIKHTDAKAIKTSRLKLVRFFNIKVLLSVRVTRVLRW